MISIEELKNIAKIKGISNLGYAEKDYLIELILLIISRNTKNELVFKGGTCLYKFYKLDRFSEDIDFSAVKEIDIEKLLNEIILGLKLFGIESYIKENKKKKNSILIVINAKGPLYSGTTQTLANIRIDINLKSEVRLNPEALQYNPIYPDIGAFIANVMDKKEIFAEKIRVIMTREKARDVYDLWFLINLGIRCDINLINEKLEHYNLKWDIKKFRKAVLMKKSIWGMELKPLLLKIPDFIQVNKDIKDKLNFLY